MTMNASSCDEKVADLFDVGGFFPEVQPREMVSKNSSTKPTG